MAILDMENLSPNLPPAALLWSNEPPLAPQALAALLERARLSVAFELGDTLDSLQKRLLRFLELDRARLNDYYDDLRKDNERRLQKAEDERRPALEAKLTAIDAERQSKLADVEQKYHLHIQLELINLAIIAQPKLDLTVEIRKRGVTVQRRVTWDPLLHAVDELACDACNRPGQTLFLCENGHLAHSERLAPQCVNCKRAFCLKCAAEVQTCAVCERPVCVHSLKRCKDCGRDTCQEHVGECHADNGQPRHLTEPAVSQEAPPKQDQGAGVKLSTAEMGKSAKPKAPAKREIPKARTFEKPRPEVAGDYMEVYADPAEDMIVAYVKAKKRDIATRKWKMVDEGIAVNCWCEKQDCAQRGVVYYPADAEKLTEQMTLLIERFAEEYDVPLKKIRFFRCARGSPLARRS